MSDDFDLYEFPKDHIGRRTYVHVDGHSRSVPKQYTYYGTDGKNHVLPEFGGTWEGIGNIAPMIMSDMSAYTSPLDGSTISSRSHHRDHMKRHGVIEVGTEKLGNFSKAQGDRAPVNRAGGDIRRALKGY